MTQEDLNKIKEILVDSNKIIELDEKVNFYIKEFIKNNNEEDFSKNEAFSDDEFISRINKYEEISEDLEQVVILLGRWGKDEHLPIIEKLFKRISENNSDNNGVPVWLSLQWYPILLFIYLITIAALSNNNYKIIKAVLEVKIKITDYEVYPLITLITRVSEIDKHFSLLNENKNFKTPRSEYFYRNLKTNLEELIFLGKDYEYYFDECEMLIALVYAHINKHDWGMVGRFYWKHEERFESSPLKEMREDAKRLGDEWSPLKARLFNGSFDEFLKTKLKYCKED